MCKNTKVYKCYLVVFLGEYIGKKIYDIGGDDPCFCSPPTWGICRPDVRSRLSVGDTLFFLAKIDSDYILKGWFEVGKKIDYLEALNLFPERMNVIVSRQQKKCRKILWQNTDLNNLYLAKYANNSPGFLLDIKTSLCNFYQNPADNHEIDNWKCKRIFRCRKSQLKECIEQNSCLKNNEDFCNDKYKNYIVAKKDKWADVDHLKITLCDIGRNTGFYKPVRHGLRHNPVLFNDYKDSLLEFIKKREKCYKR